MLVDWLTVTCWLRGRGMNETDIAAETARNLHGHPYHIDVATVGPERRAKAVRRPARWFDTDETCQQCGHIFVAATTCDVELVTGLCQTCWGQRTEGSR